MIEGKKVQMGGKEWIVPPLNFRSLKAHREALMTATPASLVASGKVVDLIHEALKRNYPELTLDELEDMLDMGNALAVTEAVLGVSGLVERESGEAPAATTSTGESSTAS
jgi:hypothetical protein